jgi:hypothetical protein
MEKSVEFDNVNSSAVDFGAKHLMLDSYSANRARLTATRYSYMGYFFFHYQQNATRKCSPH